jgi:AcrR family transcriptional regulator
MSEAVNSQPSGRRRYDASGRREKARQTRSAILDAARRLFVERGYAATSVAAIAAAAGVAPDTVYASVGPKPALFRELIELALSGTGEPVPGAERDYAVRMRAASDARAKLRIYAAAVTANGRRLTPLFVALRAAAPAAPELQELWEEISRRRARNMRLLVADLAVTGELRADLSQDEMADVIWTMNSAEYFDLLTVRCGWSESAFERWLYDAWVRLLLEPGDGG